MLVEAHGLSVEVRLQERDELVGSSGHGLRDGAELPRHALQQPGHLRIRGLGQIEAHDAVVGEDREGVAEGRRSEVVAEGHVPILTVRVDSGEPVAGSVARSVDNESARPCGQE